MKPILVLSAVLAGALGAGLYYASLQPKVEVTEIQPRAPYVRKIEKSARTFGRTPESIIQASVEPMGSQEMLARALRKSGIIGSPVRNKVGATIYSNWTLM